MSRWKIARVQFRLPPPSQVGAGPGQFEPDLMRPLSKIANFLTQKRKWV